MHEGVNSVIIPIPFRSEVAITNNISTYCSIRHLTCSADVPENGSQCANYGHSQVGPVLPSVAHLEAISRPRKLLKQNNAFTQKHDAYPPFFAKLSLKYLAGLSSFHSLNEMQKLALLSCIPIRSFAICGDSRNFGKVRIEGLKRSVLLQVIGSGKDRNKE